MSSAEKVVNIKPQSLNKALLAARQKFGRVTKDNKANVGKYSYTYADLGGILEAVEPALTEQGILIKHKSRVHDGVPYVVTQLVLVETNEADESEWPVPPGTAQEQGSWITYLRRYQLVCMLSLNVEDDDGAHASKPKNGQPKPAEPMVPLYDTLTPEQVKAAWDAASKVWDREESMGKMRDLLTTFGVDKTAQVPASKFQALLDAIAKEKK